MSILVFDRSREEADSLSLQLTQLGHCVVATYGDLETISTIETVKPLVGACQDFCV